MRTERLTSFEATSLMIGSGVGAGIMAVPYLANRVGLPLAAAALAVAWLASLLVHLMLAEVALRTPRRLQVLELMRSYVLRRPAVIWPVFALMAVAFLANLSAYLHGSAVIVIGWTGWPFGVALVVAYGVTALVVLRGLKGVGVAERLGALGLVGLVLLIGGAATREPLALRAEGGGGVAGVLALYAMAMYAFWTFYGVPQVIAGLAGRPRAAVRAIGWGLAGNGLLTVLLAVVALALPGEVTEVAIVGIAAALAPWVGVAGTALTLVALQTSAWSVTLALVDVIAERTGASRTAAWAAATLLPLVAAWAGLGFVDALRLAAGATGVVLALVTVPMLGAARREGAAEPGWTLGRWGGRVGVAVATALLVAMAVGSLLPLP